MEEEEGFHPPGWADLDGERWFVVCLTPAGLPIGIRGEEAAGWLDDDG